MKIKLTESKLKQIVAESVKKVLNERTTDSNTEELWEMLKMTIGTETMLDCIYAWASADEIEQWIKWFEEEGYFGEY